MYLSTTRCFLILGACLAIAASSAHAAPTATMQELLNGESISIGNAQFTDWRLVSLNTTAPPTPDLSRIVVTPSVDVFGPRLDFGTNGQLAVTGINSLDFTFEYQLRTLDPARRFNSHTLELTGTAITVSGGLAFITDELTSPPGTDLASLLVIDDQTSDFQQTFDLANFTSRSNISVVTNIFASGLSAADSVQLFSFSQSFFQTGPNLLPGDYNNNGAVDAADYTLWRDHLGAPPGTLLNDVDGGPIDQDQYETWKDNFGTSAAAAFSNSPVPEPMSALLLLTAIITLHLRQNRSSRHPVGRDLPASDTEPNPSALSAAERALGSSQFRLLAAMMVTTPRQNIKGSK